MATQNACRFAKLTLTVTKNNKWEEELLVRQSSDEALSLAETSLLLLEMLSPT
jgi:hypothetical protein